MNNNAIVTTEKTVIEVNYFGETGSPINTKSCYETAKSLISQYYIPGWVNL